MMKITATVAMAKKMPRKRRVSRPTPKPSSPPITAPATIWSRRGAPRALNRTAAEYAPRPKNAGVPKFT
jgi:hypothetical protein